MPESPCLTLSGRDGPCEHQYRDKSDPDCVNCRPRIEYAVAEGMLSPEVLEVKDDPMILEAREKALDRKPRSGRPRGSTKKKEKCSTTDCRWDAQIKGKCRSCYGKAYRKAKKVKKEGGDTVGVKKEEKRCKCKPGCTAKIKAREMCDTAYSKWKYQNPDKVRHYSKVSKGEKVTHFDVRLQARAGQEKYQLLEKAAEIARLQYRTIQNQIFFWMKEGIERWKGEHVNQEKE